MPTEFKVIERTAGSVKLSWLAPPFTGDNLTFIININNSFNLTTLPEEIEMSDEEESTLNRLKLVEIKGLQAEQTYQVRVLAFNSIGYSQFSLPLQFITLEKRLSPEAIPEVSKAQFDDSNKAICFHVDMKSPALPQGRLIEQLVLKLEISAVQDGFSVNKSSTDLSKRESQDSTLLINLGKLKPGRNCIPFADIASGSLRAHEAPESVNQQHIYDLQLLNRSRDGIHKFGVALKDPANPNQLGTNFLELKYFSKINISLCFANDSTVCTGEITVNDYNAESYYITLIAIGCSVVLILVILLITSLCCCFCCARKQQQASKASVPVDQKLAIKHFPAVTSTKSSQQHILSGAELCSHSSGSSTSSHTFAKHSNEKTLYYNSNPNKMMDMFDGAYTQPQNNTSSIATVESDVSSSGTSKSSTNHSPYTVMTTDNTANFASISSSSYTNMGKVASKPPTSSTTATTFMYNGSSNMYIKAYPQQRFMGASHESPESGYSTPVNNSGNTMTTKKLVYEVIV